MYQYSIYCSQLVLHCGILLICHVLGVAPTNTCYSCTGAECETGQGRVEQCMSKSDVCAVWRWRKDSPKHKAGDLYRKQCVIVLVVIEGCRVDGAHDRCICKGNLCNTNAKRPVKKDNNNLYTTNLTRSSAWNTTHIVNDIMNSWSTTESSQFTTNTISEEPSISDNYYFTFPTSTVSSNTFPAFTSPSTESRSGYLTTDEQPKSEEVSRELIFSKGYDLGSLNMNSVDNSESWNEINAENLTSSISSVDVKNVTFSAKTNNPLPLAEYTTEYTTSNRNITANTIYSGMKDIKENMTGINNTTSISAKSIVSTSTDATITKQNQSLDKALTMPSSFGDELHSLDGGNQSTTLHDIAKSLISTSPLAQPSFKCTCGVQLNVTNLYASVALSLCRPLCTFCCVICCGCVRTKLLFKQILQG